MYVAKRNITTGLFGLGIEVEFSNAQMIIYLRDTENRVISHTPGLHPSVECKVVHVLSNPIKPICSGYFSEILFI